MGGAPHRAGGRGCRGPGWRLSFCAPCEDCLAGTQPRARKAEAPWRDVPRAALGGISVSCFFQQQLGRRISWEFILSGFSSVFAHTCAWYWVLCSVVFLFRVCGLGDLFHTWSHRPLLQRRAPVRGRCSCDPGAKDGTGRAATVPVHGTRVRSQRQQPGGACSRQRSPACVPSSPAAA